MVRHVTSCCDTCRGSVWDSASGNHLHKPSSKTIVIYLGKRAWSVFWKLLIYYSWVLVTSRLGGALLYRLANSVINRIISSQSCWRFGWPDYGDVACDPYYLGYALSDWSYVMNRVLHATFQNNKLKKGRWSWISNCSAFHTAVDWLRRIQVTVRDASLQALLPGPRYGTLGPARMLGTCCATYV